MSDSKYLHFQEQLEKANKRIKQLEAMRDAFVLYYGVQEVLCPHCGSHYDEESLAEIFEVQDSEVRECFNCSCYFGVERLPNIASYWLRVSKEIRVKIEFEPCRKRVELSDLSPRHCFSVMTLRGVLIKQFEEEDEAEEFCRVNGWEWVNSYEADENDLDVWGWPKEK